MKFNRFAILALALVVAAQGYALWVQQERLEEARRVLAACCLMVVEVAMPGAVVAPEGARWY